MSATPLSRNIKGWWHDIREGRLSAYFNGTAFLHGNASGLTLPLPTTLSGAATVGGALTAPSLIFSGAGALRLGAAETPTIVSGVLTVTRPYVNPLPESSTSDTVDSIVYTGAVDGQLLLIHVPATNTITFDDAAINLGAATRAVAPGGSLLLVFDGTQWSEIVFNAATDNA